MLLEMGVVTSGWTYPPLPPRANWGGAPVTPLKKGVWGETATGPVLELSTGFDHTLRGAFSRWQVPKGGGFRKPPFLVGR